MLKTLGILLLIAVFCFGASIGYFNATPVQFDYLIGAVQIKLVVLLLMVFGIAVIVTLVLCSVRLLGQHAELRRLRRQLREMETELKNLRNLPLRNP